MLGSPIFGNSQIDRSIETGTNLFLWQSELEILRDVFSSIFVVVLLAAFQRFPKSAHLKSVALRSFRTKTKVSPIFVARPFSRFGFEGARFVKESFRVSARCPDWFRCLGIDFGVVLFLGRGWYS